MVGYFVVFFLSDILGLQDIQTDLATLIGEQADDVKLIGMYNNILYTAQPMCDYYTLETLASYCKASSNETVQRMRNM